MNKEWEIINKYHNETQALKDTIQGEFSRICLTHSVEQLGRMNLLIRENLDKLFNIKLREINELKELENDK